MTNFTAKVSTLKTIEKYGFDRSEFDQFALDFGYTTRIEYGAIALVDNDLESDTFGQSVDWGKPITIVHNGVKYGLVLLGEMETTFELDGQWYNTINDDVNVSLPIRRQRRINQKIQPENQPENQPTLTTENQPENKGNKTMNTVSCVIQILNDKTGKYEVIESSDTSLVSVGATGNSTHTVYKDIGSTWLVEIRLTGKGSLKIDQISRFDQSIATTSEQTIAPIAPIAPIVSTVVVPTVDTPTVAPAPAPAPAPIAPIIPVASVAKNLLPLDFSKFGNQDYFVSSESRKILGVTYAMLKSDANTPVKLLLTGDSGNGKTTLIEKFASFIGLDFVRINCATMRDVTDWFGRVTVEEKNGASVMSYESSEFMDAMTRGNCVICLDEFNRVQSDLHNPLFPLFDDAATTTVHKMSFKVGPNVIFAATCNLGYQFDGTFEIDLAMFNRFETILEIGSLPVDIESDLLRRKYDLPDYKAEMIVRLATSIRDNQLTICSTRSTLAIAKLVAHGLSIFDAYDTHLIRRVQNDGAGMLVRKSILELIKSTIDTTTTENEI